MQKVYNWKEVLEIQDGKGNKVHLPSIDELDINTKFTLVELSLDEINTEFLSTLEDLEKFDCYDDVIALRNLITAYNNGEDVPPIVVDKHGDIIEGYHRIPAQIKLGRDKFVAFKELR